MRKFSLRALFGIVTVIALVIVAAIGALNSYRQHQFNRTIASAWAESPVTSTRVQIGETNDIVISFDNNGLHFPETGSGTLVKRANSGEQNYD